MAQTVVVLTGFHCIVFSSLLASSPCMARGTKWRACSQATYFHSLNVCTDTNMGGGGGGGGGMGER